MIALNKNFKYNKDLSAINCSDKRHINDVIAMSKSVSKNASKTSIRFKIITMLYVIERQNRDSKLIMYEIEDIVEGFKMERNPKNRSLLYDEITDMHDSLDNNMFATSKDIIYTSIYIAIQKQENNEFSEYLEKLFYAFIHPFKLILHNLNSLHNLEWNDVFDFDAFDHSERINLFIHHSCGLRYSDTYFPYLEDDQTSKEYATYMKELEDDISLLLSERCT